MMKKIGWHCGIETIILGIALIFSTLITIQAYKDKINLDETEEESLYYELGAKPNMLYGGYSVEELCENYQKPLTFLNKRLIDFKVLPQNPELPTGCEVTCATALLNFLGFDIDKVTLADNYMPCETYFFHDSNNQLRGPDPYLYFVGDPHKFGYGCYSPVIVKTINSYLENIGQNTNYEAIDVKDLNSIDLEKLIDGGVPIIVWASKEMQPYKYSEQSIWIGNVTDRQITWLGNSHTLVIIGYDANAYYFMDCSENEAIVPYSKNAFLEKWTENGSQAVIIKIKG